MRPVEIIMVLMVLIGIAIVIASDHGGRHKSKWKLSFDKLSLNKCIVKETTPLIEEEAECATSYYFCKGVSLCELTKV